MQSLRQATAQRMQCEAAANQPRKPHGSAVELGMRTMFSRVTCSWNLQELGVLYSRQIGMRQPAHSRGTQTSRHGTCIAGRGPPCLVHKQMRPA